MSFAESIFHATSAELGVVEDWGAAGEDCTRSLRQQNLSLSLSLSLWCSRVLSFFRQGWGLGIALFLCLSLSRSLSLSLACCIHIFLYTHTYIYIYMYICVSLSLSPLLPLLSRAPSFQSCRDGDYVTKHFRIQLTGIPHLTRTRFRRSHSDNLGEAGGSRSDE